MSKRKLHIMSIRTRYQLQDSTGTAIDHRNYEAAITNAAHMAVPDKKTIVYDDHFLIEVLHKDEETSLKMAIANAPELTTLSMVKLQTLFCEMDGTPIAGIARYRELAEEEDRIRKEEYIAEFGEEAYYDGEDEFVNWL